jgi:hypothetical protein
MRPIRALGASLATTLALAALVPAGAMATNKLVLDSGGQPLADGATVFDELRIADCLQFSEGTLKANARAKVTAKFTTVVERRCEVDFPGNGGIKKATLSATGEATFKGNFELTVPGPCTYRFRMFHSHFAIPGFVVTEGEEVGTLNPKASGPGCEPTRTELFEADVDIAAFGAPLETQFLAT